MKFWLSKNSEISLREQLARQIMLAVAAGELRPHDKLPSVREMAMRYEIHPNTVSAAYVWLEERGWVESKKGSGVFIREKSARELRQTASSSQSELDELINRFFREAQTRGFTPANIAARLKSRLEQRTISEILLVEPDAEMRRILAFEINAATDLPVWETDLENFAPKRGALVVGLAETIKKMPPDDGAAIILNLNSAQAEMRGKERPLPDEIIGIASRWELFLRWSNTMLVAAGIAAEQILVRDAKIEGWQRGLSTCAFVVCDSLTARQLPKSIHARIFRLIAADSLAALRGRVEI